MFLQPSDLGVSPAHIVRALAPDLRNTGFQSCCILAQGPGALFGSRGGGLSAPLVGTGAGELPIQLSGVVLEARGGLGLLNSGGAEGDQVLREGGECLGLALSEERAIQSALGTHEKLKADRYTHVSTQH